MLSFFCIAPRTMLTLNNNSSDVYGSLLNSNGTGPVTVIRMGYYAVYKVSTVIPLLTKILKTFFPLYPLAAVKLLLKFRSQFPVIHRRVQSSQATFILYSLQNSLACLLMHSLYRHIAQTHTMYFAMKLSYRFS